MSTLYMFPPTDEPPEDGDVLAGEYALGVLDPGEAAATRLRTDAEPALRDAILAWQARLAPMTNGLALSEPPPALWSRLAAEIGLVSPPRAAPPPVPQPVDMPMPVPPDPVPAPPPAPVAASAPLPVLEPEPEPAPEPEAEPEPEPEPVRLAPTEPPEPKLDFPAPPQSAPGTVAYAPVYQPAELPPPTPLPMASTMPMPALQPATALFEPVEMPLDRTEPAVPKTGVPWFDRLVVWRATTAVALMLAAGLAITMLQHRSTASIRAIAAMGPVNAPAPLFLAEADTAGHLSVTALATIAVPSGRDLELWIVPPGSTAAPTSLGVLPPAGRTLTLGTPLAEGTQLLVSMERHGGATGGKLTGPVLYGGTLANR